MSPLLWWLIPLVATLAAIAVVVISSRRREKVSRRDLDRIGEALGTRLPEARAHQEIDLTDVRIVADEDAR